MAQQFTVSQLKEMAKLYVQRMLEASNSTSVNLQNENLILRIDRKDIEGLMQNPDVDGLLTIICLNNQDSQNLTSSIAFVPCDDKGMAVKTNGKMIGLERLPVKPPKLKDIVYPNGGNEDILQGIIDAFDGCGITD